VLSLLAAFLAASTTAPLEASMPWWERISVTLDDKGNQQSCNYQSSLSPMGPEACDEEMASTMPSIRAGGGPGLYSKLTFERRFSPGAKLDSGRLQAGDKLLGQQVMHLSIGADGTINSCKVVGKSGELIPTYDCEEVKSEQFRVAASAPAERPRQAFMTIMVYGHNEQIA
jgi:hypothetical protein